LGTIAIIKRLKRENAHELNKRGQQLGKALDVLKEKGITFYQSERFNLDTFYFENYQDEGNEVAVPQERHWL
jgi:hypothetical protein